MCTTLAHPDQNGNYYHGRTLELDVEEVYAVAYVPVGTALESVATGHDPLKYDVKIPFIAVGAPDRQPTKEQPLTINDVKIIEGLNLDGLTFSLLAYPTQGGVEQAKKITKAILDAVDVGSWSLSQCSTVEDVKAGLKADGVNLTRLAMAGDAPLPFHMLIRDKSGKSIVLEWINGELEVHDNPVGIMTNGPDFQWHMTNLNNWTHLTNVDVSKNKFGDLEVSQPDSGIATESIPGSSTSVGRFIKAVFYNQFTEKAASADDALINIARIMDNFDRPRGVTTDPGSEANLPGTQMVPGAPNTEYTSWTNLSDQSGGKFMVRAYKAFNYTSYDLKALSEKKEIQLALLTQLKPLGGDGTDQMMALPASS